MKPVLVELTDFKTKEVVDELEVDAVLVATGRAPYTQVPSFTQTRCSCDVSAYRCSSACRSARVRVRCMRWSPNDGALARAVT